MLVLVILLFFSTNSAYGWSGYDSESGTSVEIDSGNLVREGETIEFFEYGNGYGSMNIRSMRSYGNHVEIEGFDHESGEIRTFEMDRHH